MTDRSGRMPGEGTHFPPINPDQAAAAAKHASGRLARAIRTSQIFFDSIASSNYDGPTTPTTGFKIDVDGSSFFGSGVVIGADLKSSDWDGASDDLSSGPVVATEGYLLDYSSGAAQFQDIYAEGGQLGALTVKDTLTMTTDGEILGASTYPHFRVANVVSDDATAGAVYEFRRVSGDDYNPKLWANDDYIGMFSRWADKTAADTYQAAVTVGGNPAIAQPRAQMTNSQGYSTNSSWIELWNPKDTFKGIELGTGASFSASELGAGWAAMRFISNGDATGFIFDADPAAAEWHTSWQLNSAGHARVIDDNGNFLWSDGSQAAPAYSWFSDPDTGLWWISANLMALSAGNTKVQSWNESGPATENALTVFPSTVNGKPTNITTFGSSGSWIAGTAYTIWTHGGTTRIAEVWAIGRFEWGEVAAVAYTGQVRLGVSFDGGSTWSYGQSSIHYMGTGTGGCGYRGSGTVLFNGESASVTGDIQMRLEHQVSNTAMDRLINMELIGHAEQIF